MAVTVRSASTYASAATEASTSGLALPSGWQPGDVIYIGCELTAATGSITTPSGWTAVVAQFVSAVGGTPTSGHHAVYRRVMQAGDTAPTISFTSGRFAAALVAVQGADNTTPEDVTPTTDDNTGVSVPSVRAPSVTPVTANCLLLTFHAVRNLTNGVLTSFTPDASETEQADAGTAVAAASEAAVEAASLALGTAAATGTKTATATGSNVTSLNLMGSAVAVRPSSGTSIPVTDSGSADDSQVSAVATVPAAETGSAADTATVSATVPAADTGTAADALTVTVAVPLADTGTGDGTLAALVALALTDAGAALDTILAGQQAVIRNATSAPTVTAQDVSLPTVSGAVRGDSVAALATSSAGATDPRDGASQVTAAATSTPAVSDG